MGLPSKNPKNHSLRRYLVAFSKDTRNANGAERLASTIPVIRLGQAGGWVYLHYRVEQSSGEVFSLPTMIIFALSARRVTEVGRNWGASSRNELLGVDKTKKTGKRKLDVR